MSENEHDHQQGGLSSDEPVESGALEEEDDLDSEDSEADDGDGDEAASAE